MNRKVIFTPLVHTCLLLMPFIAFVFGCQRGPEVYQVSGKVTYKDGSVPKAPVALVRFEPASNSTATIRKNASGYISPDGTFELYTRKPGDGVHRGEYKVAFTIAKSATDPKPLILEKYWNMNESPYIVTVDKDMDDLKFEIEPLPGSAGT